MAEGTIEKIENLASHASQTITRLQDFVVLTNYVYSRYAEMVKEGHIRGSVVNAQTETQLNDSELARIVFQYGHDDLPKVVLYEAVAIYETFFFSFLGILLRHNPRALSQRRQVAVEQIVEAGDFEILLDKLIDTELHDLSYKSVRDWFVFLGKIIKVDAVSAPDIERLAEIKATRDIHLHNAGIVNETYTRKAGSRGRAKYGQKLPVEIPYVYEGAKLLKALIAQHAAAVRSRLDRA